jgi:WD40 repeat protein
VESVGAPEVKGKAVEMAGAAWIKSDEVALISLLGQTAIWRVGGPPPVWSAPNPDLSGATLFERSPLFATIAAVASRDRSLILWDPETRGRVRRLNLTAQTRYTQLRWRPSSAEIALATFGGEVLCFDPVGQRTRWMTQRAGIPVFGAAWEPTGRNLAVTFADGVIWVIDGDSGELRGDFHPAEEMPGAILWDSAGHRLIVGAQAPDSDGLIAIDYPPLSGVREELSAHLQWWDTLALQRSGTISATRAATGQ